MSNVLAGFIESHPFTLTVNGQSHRLAAEPWTTLLDLLRDGLGLTGTKKGCNHGQCGACTVLLDGVRVSRCLLLAVMQDGRAVTTVEGLSDGDALHPIQRAFIARDAFQCGYCTPGQRCSAVGLIAAGRARTAAIASSPRGSVRCGTGSRTTSGSGMTTSGGFRGI